jgi:integrase
MTKAERAWTPYGPHENWSPRELMVPMKLTKDTIDKLKLPPGADEHVVWDDDIAGFGVRLRAHSATYIFRYRHGKRRPRVTIGSVSAISVQQARATAAQLYARSKLGQDPAGERTEARTRANETFALALKPYLVHMQAKLRPGSFENVDRHLMKHAKPLHRLELTKAAERRTVASLLTTVATTSGPVEANSMKGSLSGFFVWAIGQGLLEGTDPTMGMASAPINGPRTHVPTDAEIVKIWNALRADDYGDIIKLLVLSICRLTEIGSLTWDEADFQARLIRLPAERTKMGIARDVPMSKPVREILQRRHQQWDGKRALVFGTGEGGFSGWSRAKRDLDVRAGVTGWTHHDLRRYGSTTMNNEGLAPPHIVEACLGHAVLKYVTDQGQIITSKSVERRYNYATYPEQVRTAMEAWADRTMALVSGERQPTKVLALRRRRGA